jgi:hypothetical protein
LPERWSGSVGHSVEPEQGVEDQCAAEEQENSGQYLNQDHRVHLMLPPYSEVRSGQVQSFAAFSLFDKSFFVFFSPLRPNVEKSESCLERAEGRRKPL